MQFNPFEPAYRADPHPFLHALRAAEPVHHSTLMDAWVLTRHEDVTAALKHPSLSAELSTWPKYTRYFIRQDTDEHGAVNKALRHWLVLLDAPGHTRIRKLVSREFSPTALETQRPMIRAVAGKLLDCIVDGCAEVDLIDSFAAPFPVKVIADMLGIDEQYFPRVQEWSRALLPCFGPPMSKTDLDAANIAMTELGRLFENIVEERQRRGGAPATLIDRLIAAREQEDRLSHDELIANAVLFVFAGHMTTIQLIVNLVLALQHSPDQCTLLRNHPDSVGAAVEETLRMASPVQLVYRVTTAPVEFGGVSVPARSLVIASLAAANRDPAVYPDPDRFDLSRESRHLAFGHGAHFCLGAALARLEAGVALPLLLERFPTLGNVATGVSRETSLMFRGVERLSIAARE